MMTLEEKMSGRARAFAAITELLSTWQDGIPDERTVRARIEEIIPVPPQGLIPSGVALRVRQAAIDEVVEIYRMCVALRAS